MPIPLATGPHAKAMNLLATTLSQANDERPAELTQKIRENLDAIAGYRYLSYRDGALVLLALSVASEDRLDVCSRPEGARAVATFLGREVYIPLHIPGTDDAFANIGKNSSSLVRGNFEPFDELLRWMSEATTDPLDIEAAFNYLAAKVAAAASPPSGWVEPDPASLTFGKLAAILDLLLDERSGGIFEQYIMAALIKTIVDQEVSGQLSVATKRVSASDATSILSGDIQVNDETGKPVQVFEVTANHWATKIPQARRTLRSADCDRVVIIGDTAGETLRDIASTLPEGENIVVLDLRWAVGNYLARLAPASLAAVLEELYRLLQTERSRPDLLARFTELLGEHDVVPLDARDSAAPPE